MPPALPTIFALSSGRPPAAIAVVRISGPRAGEALQALTGRVPEPRRAALARLRDPATGEPLDEALALWFPAPRSETGEDMAELQLHGGRAVIAAVLAALGRLDGFRPAEAGEFTRRAFENGRLDLTAVEGLADLIGAETEAQRRQAYRQLKGLLGDRAETWRGRLIGALALVEAGIDFSDEADVPQDLLTHALDVARALRDEISAVLAQAGRGERLRDGLVVAIAGPPNAGKSTLLNRIAKREAAIVSPFAGTTRDVIEVHLDLDGYPVTLLDTAGVRETGDPVEQEGVRRARERAAAADLVLWVVSADGPAADYEAGGGPLAEVGDPAAKRERLNSEGARPLADASTSGSAASQGADRSVDGEGRDKSSANDNVSGAGAAGRPMADGAGAGASQAAAATQPMADTAPAPPVWLILNKSDLPQQRKNELSFKNEYQFNLSISACDGSGIDALLQALNAHVKGYFRSESGLITRERHRHHLRETESALTRALAETSGREDIVAEELRLASRALGHLTGKVDVEDILDVIFRDFCIGK
ncbi:MAG: tRNA modification GTPase [Alphaproteobacteria bacterium]|nr:tRNA modification GTPase [Alphaproteobacteria bacterium]